jgi:hypothetical protein
MIIKTLSPLYANHAQNRTATNTQFCERIVVQLHAQFADMVFRVLIINTFQGKSVEQ